MITKTLRALALLVAFSFAVVSPSHAQFADQKTWAGTSTGSLNNYSITIANWTANLPNVRLGFIANFSNTGATQINVSGVGLTAVKKLSPTGIVPLVGGEIIINGSPIVYFDGTQFILLNPVNVASPPTRTTFAATSANFCTGSAPPSGTYTPPVGATRLFVRMIGGGGAGGPKTSSPTGPGGSGNLTQFGTVLAQPGIGGTQSGAGGTFAPSGASGNGSGTASLRVQGASGNYTAGLGFKGAASFFGDGGPNETGDASVYGAGGGSPASASGSGAGSGGAGEYVEIVINSPASSYTYLVGCGGNPVPFVGSGVNGGKGFGGIIIIDEYYN